MKKIAILLLTLLIESCSTGTTAVQQAAGGTWQAQLVGGTEGASGFSFNTQFTVLANGSLSFSTFQFLNQSTCFPVVSGSTITPTGAMALTVNTTTYQVTGTLVFTVVANGNTLTLNGTVTGTENGENGTLLTNGSVSGSWSLTGSGANGCNDASQPPPGGSFTMTQSSTT